MISRPAGRPAGPPGGGDQPPAHPVHQGVNGARGQPPPSARTISSPVQPSSRARRRMRRERSRSSWQRLGSSSEWQRASTTRRPSRSRAWSSGVPRGSTARSAISRSRPKSAREPPPRLTAGLRAELVEHHPLGDPRQVAHHLPLAPAPEQAQPPRAAVQQPAIDLLHPLIHLLGLGPDEAGAAQRPVHLPPHQGAITADQILPVRLLVRPRRGGALLLDLNAWPLLRKGGEVAPVIWREIGGKSGLPGSEPGRKGETIYILFTERGARGGGTGAAVLVGAACQPATPS